MTNSPLKPYKDYRESGLPGIGTVPSHWRSVPGLGAYREKQIRNLGMMEKVVLSLSYGRIIVKSTERMTGLLPESFETYQVVDPGDIIIRSTDLQNDKTSLRIGLVKTRGIITAAYLNLRATAQLLPEYGYLQVHTLDLTKMLYGLGSGLRQNLSYRDFRRLPIFIPPTEEQAAIVRYLDWACGRLDRAIRAKRKIVSLLDEQKQAIICRAVTQGLDVNMRRRSSGISWLPEVPSHWKVVRNLGLFSNRVESGRENLPILQVSIRAGITFDETDQFGRPKRLIAEVSKYKLVRHRDLAYNTMRMWQGAIGVSPADGLVSPAYVVLQPRRGTNSDYYNYVFRMPLYMGQVNRYSTGIVSDRNRLYWDSFKQMPNIAPPIDEQAAIVDFIGRETASLDGEIGRAEREIALLREYRTRLIADVVTGKLDALEVAAKLPEVTLGPEMQPEPGPEEAELEEELVEEE